MSDVRPDRPSDRSSTGKFDDYSLWYWRLISSSPSSSPLSSSVTPSLFHSKLQHIFCFPKVFSTSDTHTHQPEWLHGLLTVSVFRHRLRIIGQDTKFTVPFFFVCTVTDFSAGASPIGVKFCMAVRSDLRQVFSRFGGIWRHIGLAGYASCWSTCFFSSHFIYFLFTVSCGIGLLSWLLSAFERTLT